MVLIFTALDLILSRAYSGESVASVCEQAASISKKLLANHLPIMYDSMRNISKKSVIVSCLKLLTSIVMQGSWSAQNAVLSFDFLNENFVGLFTRKYTKV
jgi:hypothetical protein